MFTVMSTNSHYYIWARCHWNMVCMYRPLKRLDIVSVCQDVELRAAEKDKF